MKTAKKTAESIPRLLKHGAQAGNHTCTKG